MKYYGSFDVVTGLYSFLAGMFFFISVLLLFQMICMILLFRKAGYGGWEAIIPFYNTYCMFTMVGLKGWLVFLAFIPFVNFVFIVFALIASYRLPICFGKSSTWGVLNIFFGIVILPILAFSKNIDYIGVE